MTNTGMMAAVAAAAGLGDVAPVEMTSALVAEHFPAIAAELKADGAKAERERLAAMDAQALPGHDKLVASFKADPSKSAGDLAMAIVAAEKQTRAGQMAALDADEAKLKGLAPAPANGLEAAKPNPLAGLEGEALWKAEFAQSADLKAEFTVEANYVAYRRAAADGRARILNKKTV